ncbi:MAG: hypothetical protein JSV36_12675 [Anaerolineae bacterium]|nr:MAG: hypothetical protein JSV36_12675 [Anaerolineae bacterium]
MDLFRLCVFVKEQRANRRDNARYFLAAFDRKPTDYLAFSRRSREFPCRKWLHHLLEPGEKQIHISLEQEPPSFRQVFSVKTAEHDCRLEMNLRIVTHAFSPIEPMSEFLCWGYLVRIVDFEISYYGETLSYKDTSQAFWSEEQEKTQKCLIEKAISL